MRAHVREGIQGTGYFIVDRSALEGSYDQCGDEIIDSVGDRYRFTLGVGDTLHRFFSKEYRISQDVACMDILCRWIGDVENADAQKVIAATKFYRTHIKKVKRQDVAPHLTEMFQRVLGLDSVLYAARLGVPKDTFSGEGGREFYHFLAANFLHKKFERFDSHAPYRDRNTLHAADERKGFVTEVDERHHVKILNGSPSLLYKGEWRSWAELKKMIESGEIIVDSSSALMNCIYTYRGIMPMPLMFYDRTAALGIDFNACSLEELLERYCIVFEKKDPAMWHSQWVFSVACEADNECHRARGDHGWYRLKAPTGEIYTVAFWRDKFGLMKDTGRFKVCDDFEFSSYGGTHEEIEFSVTSEEIKAVLVKLLSDVRDGYTAFDLAQRNCSTYGRKLLKRCGIDFRPGMHAMEYSSKMSARFLMEVPFLKKAVDVAINCILALAGMMKVEAALIAQIEEWEMKGYPLSERVIKKMSRPHIPSWRDLFKSSRTVVESPHKVRELQHEIKIFRAKKRARVETQYSGSPDYEERVRESHFAVPDSMRLHS